MQVDANHWTMTDAAWSPNGRLFAVVLGYRDPHRSTIGIVERNGTTHIVADDSVQLGSPQWSATGTAVYYMRDVYGKPSIRKVPVSKSGRALAAPADLHADLEALHIYDGFSRFSLTRDGQRAVYTRGSRFSNLWMLEASGETSAPRSTALTRGTALLWSPAVSPDGEWIAFAQSTPRGAELFRMPTEGGPAMQITTGARVWRASQLAWSPQGDRIAFQSIRSGLSQIWVASASDGRLQQFPRTRVSPYSGSMTWAPATRIAYLSTNRDNVHFVNPVSGEEDSMLDSVAGSVLEPKYSPDGHRLAFRWAGLAANPGIWVYDARDSSMQKISDRPGMPIGWSADGRFVYAGDPVIRRIGYEGGADEAPVLASPLRERYCAAVTSRVRPTFICASGDFVSDAWMIENFDPEPPS